MITKHPGTDVLVEFDAMTAFPRPGKQLPPIETIVGYWDGRYYQSAIGTGSWSPEFVVAWRSIDIVPRRPVEQDDKGNVVWHPPTPSTTDEHGAEVHPAFGAIRAARVTGGQSVLFDSDVLHQQKVVVTIGRMTRRRDLHTDWNFADSRLPLIEIEMSEAQWASFVSSMNTGAVPCTIRGTESDHNVPGLELEARLGLSMDETKKSAREAFGEIQEAMRAYTHAVTAKNPAASAAEKREALRWLQLTVERATNKVEFASERLVEHAEDVTQKMRADVEAFVVSKAHSLGLVSAEDLLALGAPSATTSPDIRERRPLGALLMNRPDLDEEA